VGRLKCCSPRGSQIPQYRAEKGEERRPSHESPIRKKIEATSRLGQTGPAEEKAWKEHCEYGRA